MTKLKKASSASSGSSDTSPLSGREREKRDAKDTNLVTLLVPDDIVFLEFSADKRTTAKKIWASLEEIVRQGLKGRGEICQRTWPKSCPRPTLLLGIKTAGGSADTSHSSVLVGPLAGPDSLEAESFRTFWGRDVCQLRRFEDGSLRESVAVHNPWGPMHLNAAIVVHLVKRDVGVAAATVAQLDNDILPPRFQTREHLRTVRSVLSELSETLKDCADESLPIRRMRGLGPAVHAGVDFSSYVAPSKVGHGLAEPKSGCLLLKLQGPKIAPAAIKSIPVTLDITHKKNLSREMFSYLKLAYLISLKKTLESKNIKCMLKSERLYVIFSKLIFSLDVDPPLYENTDGVSTEDASVLLANNFLQSLGIRFPAWSGAYHVVRRWVSAKMLDSVIPELAIELCLASVFVRPVAGLDPPSTAETAVLRFFDLLSFHEFKSEPLMVNEDEDVVKKQLSQIRATMATNRESLPPIVLATPFDHLPSFASRSVSAAAAIRLVNCARETLRILTSSKPGIDWSHFPDCLRCDLSIFHVLIHLKPLQVPQMKAGDHESKALPKEFPVVDYDPVGWYLSELMANYSELATFYYGRWQTVVGVRLEAAALEQRFEESLKHVKGRFVRKGKLVANVEAMVEDFKILGAGLVKEVECNFEMK